MCKKLLRHDLHCIEVIEAPLHGKTKGLYIDGVIIINKFMSNPEKNCILAEELGHYHTSHGNILDQTDVRNRKQERRARGWAYEELIPVHSFLEAYWVGISTRYELAEFLEVTEGFLSEAIQYYKEKHGPYCAIDNYLIYFEPLGVFEKI